MISYDTKVGLDPRLPNNPAPTSTYMTALHWRLTEVLREYAQAINGQDVWDDLTFPAEGINPAGAPNAASFDTATYPGTLLFSGTVNNHVAGTSQMPHSWREGSTIKPHIHWTKTTADAGGNAVTWEFRWVAADPGDALGAMSSYIAGTLAVGDLTTSEKHNITTFGDMDMTGFAASAIIVWELRRVGSSDAYNSNARLLALDFHYQRNTDGSRFEYSK